MSIFYYNIEPAKFQVGDSVSVTTCDDQVHVVRVAKSFFGLSFTSEHGEEYLMAGGLRPGGSKPAMFVYMVSEYDAIAYDDDDHPLSRLVGVFTAEAEAKLSAEAHPGGAYEAVAVY